MSLRERIRLSEYRQQQLTWVMEFILIGLLFIGFERRSLGISINAAIGLIVLQIPPLLERDYSVSMDPRLTLWITTAVFLHSLGTVGVPGGEGFYRSIPGYDHLTHALSASVVAGVGYATIRALDEHWDDVQLPDRFVFVFILMFVLAFGVVWEIIEFTTSAAATAIGGSPVLTQYGLEDTMKDLIFNTIGAAIVATWGTVYLNDFVTQILDAVGVQTGSDPPGE
ncbi:hypothetical protein [Halorhabdus amylolytica]|uniref:hypothetical protein n=1 Tax=Halorhabdus amylolytica TaxID=2559573 RepID=UPI0010AAA9E9|nr:hypothetical protein [Halorhabdus amylolytica]